MHTRKQCDLMHMWQSNLNQLKEAWRSGSSHTMLSNILLLRATSNVIFQVSCHTIYKDNGLTSFHVMMSHQMQTLWPEQTWRHLKVPWLSTRIMRLAQEESDACKLTFVAPFWPPDRSYGFAQQGTRTCMPPLPWLQCVGVYQVVFWTPKWGDVRTWVVMLTATCDDHHLLPRGKTVPKIKLGAWATAVNHSPSSVMYNHVQPCSVISCYNTVTCNIYILTFPYPQWNGPTVTKHFSLKLWHKSWKKRCIWQ